MNETRYDWLSDRWVIFAPNREERPDQYRQTQPVVQNATMECPFCSGREHETPRPTLVLPEKDSDETTSNRRPNPAMLDQQAWQVRVVPNKFPAVSCRVSMADQLVTSHYHSDLGLSDSAISLPENTFGLSPQKQLQTATAEHLFQRNTSPRGAHEVIIESPIHVDSITSLPANHIAIIFEAYQRRLNHWRAQRDLKYAVIFKNYGADAGASLYHSHSQLISLRSEERRVGKECA